MYARRHSHADLEVELARSAGEELPADAAQGLLRRACIAGGEAAVRRAIADLGYDTDAHPDPGRAREAEGLAQRNADVEAQMHALRCDKSFAERVDSLGALHRSIMQLRAESAALKGTGKGGQRGGPGCDKRAVFRAIDQVYRMLRHAGVDADTAPFAAEVEAVGVLDVFMSSFNAAFVRVRSVAPSDVAHEGLGRSSGRLCKACCWGCRPTPPRTTRSTRGGWRPAKRCSDLRVRARARRPSPAPARRLQQPRAVGQRSAQRWSTSAATRPSLPTSATPCAGSTGARAGSCTRGWRRRRKQPAAAALLQRSSILRSSTRPVATARRARPASGAFPWRH